MGRPLPGRVHEETSTARSRGETLSAPLLCSSTYPFSNYYRSNHCSGERRPPTLLGKNGRVGENVATPSREKIAIRRARFWPKLACSMERHAYNIGMTDSSSFFIWASQTPYPRDVGRRFSRVGRLATFSPTLTHSSCIGVGGLLSPEQWLER